MKNEELKIRPRRERGDDPSRQGNFLGNGFQSSSALFVFQISSLSGSRCSVSAQIFFATITSSVSHRRESIMPSSGISQKGDGCSSSQSIIDASRRSRI